MRVSCRYQINRSKYLAPEERDRLERVLKRTLLSEQSRDALILFLALRTGARASELLNLRARDFSARYSTVFLVGLKGSNDREIPIPDWLSKKLAAHVGNIVNPEERIFPISYNRLSQIWDFYRPVKKKLHSLRHTFAFTVYAETKDVRLVQLCLGHRSISNTMVYVDHYYELEQMRRVVDCFEKPSNPLLEVATVTPLF